ncbi:helix-turn-helix domain-containing protein [Pannonibacter phragmitetus]|uniref:helix-turn-helix domain-containing protein n=1 Tax=Pannonibacter phragmitetus TaxID=121719 RepID=UPI000B973500|nr:helix-turn-helix domain-containing protein [Pannonibacter phragmitetus]
MSDGLLSRLIDLIGDEATLALVTARGGRSVYVPERPTAQTEIAKIVGLDAATILGQSFGRESIIVPVAREWRVLQYDAQAMSVPQIAALTGCHVDTVRKIRRRHGLSAAQLDLFGGL